MINTGNKKDNKMIFMSEEEIKNHCINVCKMGILKDDENIYCVNTYGCRFGFLDEPGDMD